MKKLQLFVTAVVVVWLAGGCEMGFSPHLSIMGAVPDFSIVAIGSLGLLMSRRGATSFGFVIGIVQGAVSGANLASYAISRAIVGFVAGWFNDLELESSPFLAMVVTAMITIVAQLTLMFIAPPGNILSYLAATIGAAVYNGVLAMPFYALLKRILDPHD